MKKLSKVFALATIAAAVLGFASCSNPSSSNDSTNVGGGTSVTPITISTPCKEYTTKITPEDGKPETVKRSVLALTLQMDNKGSKSADGDKITVSDLKVKITIANEAAQEIDLGTMELVPNQYAVPAYGKSDARVKFGLTGQDLAKDTEVKIQVISATVSDKSRVNDILCCLQREEDPNYDIVGAIWQPAFAAAE